MSGICFCNMVLRVINVYGIMAFIAFLSSCQKPDAAQIINRAIEVHGGKIYEAVEVEFDFRDKHYKSYYNHGAFQYERIFQDSTGQVRDVLTNDSFSRTIDGLATPVTEKKAAAYSRSINSVFYFALLPFKLNDPSVNKRYLGQVTIRDQPYHKIEVTFQEEGGGEDFEDVFIYWVHTESNAIDYLAYVYHTDGGGKRFRALDNVRIINGLRFADHINYEEPEHEHSIAQYDSLYDIEALPKLSKIELENIKVKHLD